MAKSRQKKSQRANPRAADGVRRNSRATVSGPAKPDSPVRSGPTDPADDVAVDKYAATQALASAMPANTRKPREYGGGTPLAGQTVDPADPIATASTVTEMNGSDKVGSGSPTMGTNKTIAPLDRVRAD